ncbi:hypothetical protein [Streptomyces collinus]|uniref:hypothetical protein n=1 Tax=Streptomyces collinus TaxID=42684 RepID=UPI0037F48EC3
MGTQKPNVPSHAHTRVAGIKHPNRRHPHSGLVHDNTRHTTRFTVIGNHLAQHPELSPLAIGLSVHIQSLPAGARIDIKSLAARFPEGTTRIAAALRELETHGYLRRTRERVPDSRIITRTTSCNQPGHSGTDAPRPAPRKRTTVGRDSLGGALPGGGHDEHAGRTRTRADPPPPADSCDALRTALASVNPARLEEMQASKDDAFAKAVEWQALSPVQSWVLAWARDTEIARRPDLSTWYARAKDNLEHEDPVLAQEALRELSAVLDEAMKAIRDLSRSRTSASDPPHERTSPAGPFQGKVRPTGSPVRRTTPGNSKRARTTEVVRAPSSHSGQ